MVFSFSVGANDYVLDKKTDISVEQLMSEDLSDKAKVYILSRYEENLDEEIQCKGTKNAIFIAAIIGDECVAREVGKWCMQFAVAKETQELKMSDKIAIGCSLDYLKYRHM